MRRGDIELGGRYLLQLLRTNLPAFAIPHPALRATFPSGEGIVCSPLAFFSEVTANQFASFCDSPSSTQRKASPCRQARSAKPSPGGKVAAEGGRMRNGESLQNCRQYLQTKQLLLIEDSESKQYEA